MRPQVSKLEPGFHRGNGLTEKALDFHSVSRLLLQTIAALILAVSIPVVGRGQDSSTTPPTALETAQAEAETRQAIAEARKAELDAKFPKPSTSPLDGKTTTDGDFIEGQIAAYLSLSSATDRIANGLFSHYPGIQTLVIHKPTDIALIQNYFAGRNRIGMLLTQFGNLTAAEAGAVAAAPNPAIPVPVLRPDAASSSSGRHSFFLPPPLVLGAASSTVGAFNDFLGAFRTDVSISAKSVEVSEDAVVAELFKSLRSRYPMINLYYPGLVPPKLNTLGPSAIITAIENLYDAKQKAELGAASVVSIVSKKQDQIDGLNQFINEAAGAFDEVKSHNDAQIAKIKEQVVELQQDSIKNAAKVAALHAQIAVLNGDTVAAYAVAQAAQAPYSAPRAQLMLDIVALQKSSKPLDDLIKQFDNLIKDLLKTDDSSGISLINSYVQTENLLSAMAGPNSYFLSVGFVKGGGNQKVARNLIADVFRGGSKVSYSGGVILKYNLFTPDGLSILSDTTKRYEKYMSSSQIDKRTQ